ncbi:hypothetical protein QAD02_012219 [Eretmocerus hayati]|uniref:Uncharacterized protein n=1 Tax=Eretmocerus hayati TaxID=131215 RepID=A0ACC2NZ82_9HYME|nr:hypothetical protein QAD02_012219 [Eretmocerus hayati]
MAAVTVSKWGPSNAVTVNLILVKDNASCNGDGIIGNDVHGGERSDDGYAMLSVVKVTELFAVLLVAIMMAVSLGSQYLHSLSFVIVTSLLVFVGAKSNVSAPSQKSHQPGPTDYSRLMKLSLLFYETQRSGKLGPDNRISWRGDSALGDHGDNGEDLSGGYYDAGDFVKFGFTMAWTTTILAWGGLSWPEAYKSAGQLDILRSTVKWATDYFIKCHTNEYELYGQVGDFGIDHTFWGRPEDLNTSRPAYKIDAKHPGSDLAGETSAALSAASLLFRPVDEAYADNLLVHARQLYHFASEHRGLYHEAIKGAAQYYESTGYGDELAWAAAWLHRASNQSRYFDEAEHHYRHFYLRDRPNEFFYNRKVAGIQVLLAHLTDKEEYRNASRSFCDFSTREQKRTPKGLVYIEKSGTLCHAANIAFVCLQAAEQGNIGNSREYRRFARQQIDYMLGANTGQSFVVGWGNEYPRQPYHAASSCPDKPQTCGWPDFTRDAANPQLLLGALVSGPDENDNFRDKRDEFLYTEVTLDCNAGFTGALAALLQLHLDQETQPS